jgi:hypothetical protein
MNVRKTFIASALGFGLMASGYLLAQIDPHRHPNLAAAQRHCTEATSALQAAQRANEFDMGGHAARAQQLLGDAYREIKLAAETANHR